MSGEGSDGALTQGLNASTAISLPPCHPTTPPALVTCLHLPPLPFPCLSLPSLGLACYPAYQNSMCLNPGHRVWFWSRFQLLFFVCLPFLLVFRGLFICIFIFKPPPVPACCFLLLFSSIINVIFSFSSMCLFFSSFPSFLRLFLFFFFILMFFLYLCPYLFICIWQSI